MMSPTRALIEPLVSLHEEVTEAALAGVAVSTDAKTTPSAPTTAQAFLTTVNPQLS